MTGHRGRRFSLLPLRGAADAAKNPPFIAMLFFLFYPPLDMWYLKRNYRYAKVNYECRTLSIEQL